MNQHFATFEVKMFLVQMPVEILLELPQKYSMKLSSQCIMELWEEDAEMASFKIITPQFTETFIIRLFTS